MLTTEEEEEEEEEVSAAQRNKARIGQSVTVLNQKRLPQISLSRSSYHSDYSSQSAFIPNIFWKVEQGSHREITI